MRKILPYRIGKKVGVFQFNMNKNQDELMEGRIVARRWHHTLMGNNHTGIQAEYVIRFKNGEYGTARQDEIWTKWGNDNKNYWGVPNEQ